MTVTTDHKALGDTVRLRPEFGIELLRDLFHVDIPPDHKARLESIDFSQTMPSEYRADAAIAIEHDGQAILGLIFEVQRKFLEHKRESLKVYVAALSARLHCPVALIVVCTSKEDARKFAQPIAIGWPPCAIKPLILGPKQLPVVTDRRLADRKPELAVLSAVVLPMENGSRGFWRPSLPRCRTSTRIINDCSTIR